MIPVRATCRLQLHRHFTFADAQAVVPYLADLGISHLYASPITTAQPGSAHGYDVIDPTRVNPELGGEEALRSLVATLRQHGMGLIIDIVPNHMGIAGGNNPWWQDVLEKGEASRFARFFDINWGETLLLPFLGAPLGNVLAAGDLKVEERGGRFAIVAYGGTPYPIRAEDQADIRAAGAAAFTGERLAALLDRQHYRLAWWRTANDDLHWRRFFTITELAGLRIEEEHVFEAVHALPFRLYSEGLIDGLRIDHVDGLTDPAGYLHKLRARLGQARPLPFRGGARGGERRQGLDASADASASAGPHPNPSLEGEGLFGPYLVVEKILAHDEPLDPDWPVDGTTGYDFMEEIAALLHAPQGAEPLARLWNGLTGRPADFAPEELAARRDMLAWEFEGQLAACVSAFAAVAATAPATPAFTRGMLRRALSTLLWVFPVYRTYGTGLSAPAGDASVRTRVRERALPLTAPGETRVVDAVLAWLAGTGPGDVALAAEAVRRFQQLSAPIAAKAVEDTAFYRYGRLLSRNDVGFDPERLSMPIAEFHQRMAARARRWPRAMLATATHDHKRGEDVRARLAVLSEIADEWAERTRRWLPRLGEIAPDDAYMLLQTLVGAWPADLAADDAAGIAAFGERVAAWQEKALREAKLRSSWAEPNVEYEAAARTALATLLDPARSAEALDEIAAFVRRIAPVAEANGLVQTFLRCTLPGVPDLYQGCDHADLSLVDPDNRRPVDWSRRRASLSSAAAARTYDGRKQALIAALLRLRRQQPQLFVGDYEPVAVSGARADHVIAFLRRSDGSALLAAAALRCAKPLAGGGRLVPPPDWWADTRLEIPGDLAGRASHDPLAGSAAGGITAADIFSGAPMHLRLFTDG